MAIKLGDLFNSMDEAFNNEKLEEAFNKTKDIAESVSKKSAQRLDISRKKVECLDAKAKLAKLYEKFGELQYKRYIGEQVADEEISSTADAIADNKEKVEFFMQEIEKAKEEFNESMANAAKKTRDVFNRDGCKAADDEVEVTVAAEPDTDADDADEAQE